MVKQAKAPGKPFSGCPAPFSLADGHRQAVDLNRLVCGDEDVLFPIDQPGLHQITAVRADHDLAVSSGDLKLFTVNNVLRAEDHIVAKLLLALILEGLDLFFLHAALSEHAAHLLCGDAQGLRVLALFMEFNPLPQLLVEGLEHVKGALPLHGVIEDGGEGLLLLPGVRV